MTDEAGCGIFVRDPTGEERRLTDSADDMQPAWSPDGREVAFVREGEGRCRSSRPAGHGPASGRQVAIWG